MAVSGAFAAKTCGASLGAAEIRFPRPCFKESLNKVFSSEEAFPPHQSALDAVMIRFKLFPA